MGHIISSAKKFRPNLKNFVKDSFKIDDPIHPMKSNQTQDPKECIVETIRIIEPNMERDNNLSRGLEIVNVI